MDIVGIVIFILIGLAAGFVASRLFKGRKRRGALTYILIGVVGSFIGGFIFQFLPISAGGGLLGSFITALVGSIILIFILRIVS